MKPKDKIDSHIFLPKSILNRFANIDEKNRKIIKYIDLNDMQMKCSTTASFNTELGYYSNENERVLSKEAESKIGNVITKLESIDKNTVITERDIEFIYRFLAYQVIRTDFFANRIKEHFKIFSDNKDIKNILISEEKNFDIIYRVIKRMDIHIIINRTNEKFVIPINSMYTFNPNSNEEYIWVQILSPTIAVAFMKEGTVSKLSGTDEKIKILEFTNKQIDIIRSFNLRALGVTYKDNPKMKYVIGLEEELNDLMNIINKNKE